MRKAVLLVQHPKNEIRSGMFGSHEKYVRTSFHTVQMLHCAPIVFLRNSGALQTLVSKEHLISKETIAGSGVSTPGQLRAVLGLDLFLPGLWPDLKMSWVSCV